MTGSGTRQHISRLQECAVAASDTAGLASLLHNTALDIHSTSWPGSINVHTSSCHLCCTNASGVQTSMVSWQPVCLGPSSALPAWLSQPNTMCFFISDFSDIVCRTKVKTQHFYCAPTWMLFLLLAFALLDELEPTCCPAMQAQPASTQSSHPQREGPGLTGNLTKAPVSEQHQQLPGQLLCLTPSVVICAGQQGQHCHAGPQRWHCTQLLAQQQYCCPTATTCNHHEL